ASAVRIAIANTLQRRGEPLPIMKLAVFSASNDLVVSEGAIPAVTTSRERRTRERVVEDALPSQGSRRTRGASRERTHALRPRRIASRRHGSARHATAAAHVLFRDRGGSTRIAHR